MVLNVLCEERLTGSSIKRTKLLGQDGVLTHHSSLRILCLICENSIAGSSITTANSFCRCPVDTLMTSCAVFLETPPTHSVQWESPELLHFLCDPAHLLHFSGPLGPEVMPWVHSLPCTDTSLKSFLAFSHCLDCSQKQIMRERERSFLKDASGFREQFYFMCFQNTLFCLQIYERPFITSIKYLKQK